MQTCTKMQAVIEQLAAKHGLDLTPAAAHLKLLNGGYMPLVIEKIGAHLVSVAHYYYQNGDAWADPDMVFYMGAVGWMPVEITQPLCYPSSGRAGCPAPLAAPLLPGPTLTAEGITLRLLPVLLLAVVLTAWHYRWPWVVGYCLATAALCLGLRMGALLILGTDLLSMVVRDANRPVAPLVANGIVVGIQTFGLLIAGYFVSVLLTWLRAQQETLTEANRQLRRHAGTLESLTISRERNRVARELHDTLAHTLSGLSVQLETVKAYWAVDPARAQGVLDKAQNAAREGLHETRHALTALRASPLEDLGLLLALHQLVEAAAARANLALDLSLPDSFPVLPPDVEQCLYRVAQEAIANVIYHADARRLTVALRQEQAALELLIQDDGMGFPPDRPVSPGHFGLAGMRERARLIAAHLSISSNMGAGTTVRLHIAEGVEAA